MNKPGSLKIFDALIFDEYGEGKRLAYFDMHFDVGLGHDSLPIQAQEMIVIISHSLTIDADQIYRARDPCRVLIRSGKAGLREIAHLVEPIPNLPYPICR